MVEAAAPVQESSQEHPSSFMNLDPPPGGAYAGHDRLQRLRLSTADQKE